MDNKFIKDWLTTKHGRLFETVASLVVAISLVVFGILCVKQLHDTWGYVQSTATITSTQQWSRHSLNATYTYEYENKTYTGGSTIVADTQKVGETFYISVDPKHPERHSEIKFVGFGITIMTFVMSAGFFLLAYVLWLVSKGLD